MKKIIAAVIAIAFISIPSFGEEETQQMSNTSIMFFSAVETHGNGFGYPTGTTFYVPLHGGWVMWFYTNGTTTTRYLLNPYTFEGKQIGIAYVMLGIWKAPRLFSQPGNISGNMLVFLGILIEIE